MRITLRQSMNYQFRKAEREDAPRIWNILQQAIARRKKDGSQQWQDGYPNAANIEEDIQEGVGYVLTEDNVIAGYTAVIINNEPAYDNIEGQWLTNKDFVVVHRVAIADEHAGKGLAGKMLSFVEEFAISKNIFSIKADTNFDNTAMLKTFEKCGYSFCGEVYLRGGVRKAFEKVL